MSTHGMLDEIQDHPTYQKVDGSWKPFKYSEPFSPYCRAKHWVDNVNNRRHDPIGLEEVWHTKWWPMRQFIFICSAAEVNDVQSWARAWGETTMPQLQFCQKLAKQMLTNTISVEVVPEVVCMRTRCQSNTEHKCLRHGVSDGTWNPFTCRFSETKTDYVRHRCSGCGKKSIGTTAHVTLKFPCAWGAMHYMLTTSIS